MHSAGSERRYFRWRRILGKIPNPDAVRYLQEEVRRGRGGGEKEEEEEEEKEVGGSRGGCHH